MLTQLRSVASLMLFLASEPFRYWHELLEDLANRVDPQPVFTVDDYSKASEIIARVDTEPHQR